jgi:hypothetical protein
MSLVSAAKNLEIGNLKLEIDPDPNGAKLRISKKVTRVYLTRESRVK